MLTAETPVITAPESEDRRRQIDRREMTFVAAVIVGWALWAFVLYRPWQRHPFSILDYSEFLPLLLRAHSPINQLQAFSAYYAGQGRSGLLSYAFIVLNWSAFGWNTVGWQVTRFCLMLSVAVGVMLVLRRFGASRWGAAIGASLFISSTAAVQGWLRLTGEPIGLAILLVATYIALRYQDAARWRLAAIAIACLLFLLLFAKEILVAAVPFVLLLACCRRSDGTWTLSSHAQRNKWLLLVASLAVVVALVPIAFTALSAHGQSYVASYGTGRIMWSRFRHNLEMESLPAGRTFRSEVMSLLYPANFLFLVVVASGWRVRILRTRARLDVVVLLLVALLLSAAGACIYLPWPRFEDFYGLPFLLTSALLLATAVTTIEQHVPRGVPAVYAACAILAFYSSLPAQRTARAMMARNDVNAQLARTFGDFASRDSIVVATRDLAPQVWQGTGATLRRYAVATGAEMQLPRVVDANCEQTLPLYRAGVGNAMLVSYSDQCGTFPAPTRTIRRYYRYLDRLTLTLRTDSLRADILAPPVGGHSLRSP